MFLKCFPERTPAVIQPTCPFYNGPLSCGTTTQHAPHLSLNSWLSSSTTGEEDHRVCLVTWPENKPLPLILCVFFVSWISSCLFLFPWGLLWPHFVPCLLFILLYFSFFTYFSLLLTPHPLSPCLKSVPLFFPQISEASVWRVVTKRHPAVQGDQ